MEVINCVIAVPLIIIALFFLFTGWRRGIRFNFHDYQGNKKERLRDNFFSSFTIITSICCIFPIVFPINLWGFAIPFNLLMILVVTPLAMLGAYWSSFLASVMTGGRIRNNVFLGQVGKDIPTLDWYEYTPFAFVSGWLVYYLVYVSFLLALGRKIMSDNAPIWVVFIGLVIGIITAILGTIGIKRKFRNL